MMELTINEAAQYLGVSTDTIKRRMLRGQLKARKEPRPQGYTWLIEVGNDPNGTTAEQQDHGRVAQEVIGDQIKGFQHNGSQGSTSAWVHGSIGAAVPETWTDMEVAIMELMGLREQIAQLKSRVKVQDQQLEARTREIQELHVLLQQSQKALPAPPEPNPPRWKFWRRRII